MVLGVLLRLLMMGVLLRLVKLVTKGTVKGKALIT